MNTISSVPIRYRLLIVFQAAAVVYSSLFPGLYIKSTRLYPWPFQPPQGTFALWASDYAIWLMMAPIFYYFWTLAAGSRADSDYNVELPMTIGGYTIAAALTMVAITTTASSLSLLPKAP